MTLTEDEVIKILRLVEQSTFDALHLEMAEQVIRPWSQKSTKKGG
jgi:hypothetical protein